MPIHVTKIEALPRPTRNKKRSLEFTDEWKQLQAKLAEGLRPYEAVYITFTPQQVRELKVKTLGRVFKAMTREYVRRLALPYDVMRYHSGGQEIIVVAARGAMEGRATPREEAVALEPRRKRKAG